MQTIAVDGMGGDSAPEAIVEGVVEACQLPGVHILLVGDEPRLKKLLSKRSYPEASLTILHAPQAIRMDQKPREVLEMPESSIRVAARAVAEGKADALVSAGNTGACILAASKELRRIPGVRKTALAAVYPTERRHGPHGDPFALLLDVGATVDASGPELATFALMGSAYARAISRNPRPKVALLSNGEEAMKGSPEVVEAHQLLVKMPEINFMGNIEGVDIPRGTADVVICNGFVGNIVLKMLEGISEVVGELANYALERSLVWKAGMLLLSRGIRRIRDLTDWESYGGAPILGFEKVVIKAHGRSGGRAIKNAIRVAVKAVRSDLCGQITRDLSALERHFP